MFTKVETGHVDTFELKPDEGGKRLLYGIGLKAGGSILIVAVPDEEEVAATYFGRAPSRKRIGRGWSSTSCQRSED